MDIREKRRKIPILLALSSAGSLGYRIGERNMRKLNELNRRAQTRLSDYIRMWPTATAKELAEDLYLRSATVAAVRAHITRSNVKKFNEALKR